jgi:hypothetical protein
MSDVVINVVESATNVTVTEQDVAVDVTENVVEVSESTAGIQGASYNQGDPIYVTVRNATGATLAKGTIVYISGANGNNVRVIPAIATSDATSARTLGWLSQSIANNRSGLCQVEGYLEGLNTQGFTAGQQLYLSGTTAGDFTATKPQAPIHLVYVGVVTKVSAGDGHVFVKVQNGYELGELHDVKIDNPVNNEVLTYDSATDLWINKVNAADGVTSITATAPLTGGTITSTGSIGLDQAALSITKSQVSDFTSGTVTSASTAQQAGTAVYAVNSGTAIYATTSGTALTITGSITKSQVSDFTSGTVASATNAGTSVYATNAGTAVYSTTSGTALTITGDITKSQVSDFTSGTVTSASTAQQSGTAVYAVNAGTAVYADTSGTAVFATNASTAVTISGNITPSQVTGTAVITTDSRLTDSRTPTGSAGGDLTGTYPNPTIAAGVIVDADVNASAAIAQSKISSLVSDLAGKANLAGDNTFTGAQTVNGNIIAGASGFQFRSFNEDNKNVKFSNFFSNVNEQSGMGQLFVENWIGSINAASSRRIGFYLNVPDAGTNFTLTTNADMYVTTTGVGIGTPGASVTSQLFVTSRTSGRVGAIIRGAASQTADLTQWQNSAGTNLVRVDSGGGLFAAQGAKLGLDTFTGVAFNGISNPSGITSIPSLVVKANPSQTANLQEWHNSAGVVKGYIDRFGDVSIGSLGLGFVTPYSSYGGSLLSINTVGAGNIGAVIRGFASQTADLFQIQTSAGTNIYRFDPFGYSTVTGGYVLSNLGGSLERAFGGAFLGMAKTTSAVTNPGANIARMYLVDGTVPGTLKLVVRAGAAGAETTILDNIPQ